MDGITQLTKHPQYDPKKITVIYAHGYIANQLSDTVLQITTAYLQNTGYNVLTIDWAVSALGPIYEIAFVNVGMVIATLCFTSIFYTKIYQFSRLVR